MSGLLADPALARVPAADAEVWLLDLQRLAVSQAGMRAVLNEEERQRADRFLVETPRRQFIAGRALLRHLIGSRLGVTPEAVGFVYGARGKPRLAEHHSRPLHFNLSHGGDMVLLALSETTELGVDVEPVRERTLSEGLLQRVLDEGERGEVARAKDPTWAFFAFWVRKEARAKALGLGLEAVMEPGAPGRYLPTRVIDLPVPSGYAAALAFLDA